MNMDLNLMPQEEEHETIDLNLMPQEEDDEGINLNLMPREEEPQVAENGTMDLNLMPQEEDDEAMNWMPPEDEGKEDEAQEEEDEDMNWILQEKRRELSDKERHGVYFALLVIELRDGTISGISFLQYFYTFQNKSP